MLISPFTWSSLYIATALTAKDTHFGFLPENQNGFQTARWISTRENLWDSVKGPVGSNYQTQLTWTYDDRPDSKNKITQYINTVEHNLNTAVYYAAYALNFVIDFAGYKGCSCLGKWPEQGEQYQGAGNLTNFKVQQQEFITLFFAGFKYQSRCQC
ncbi:hypothetical protein LCGC14_1406790 [marine sediment metagenome]|uniref:Uncharacterized protein n=1 Tax=marine sediment metagenome TaxID=412755 RepID=A0A0F9JVU3_9ZZZZ|nr:hypothetical protein [archaeon]